ncbi:MAG: MlaE family lipid ABC transporter permease subunit [Azospirillum sp.]|nr:MlaE family lipid ABC transporter permease subunit [Azospirillum sp.]
MARQPALTMEVLSGPADRLTVRLSGRLDATSLGPTWSALTQRVERDRPAELAVELEAVDYCDGAGASLLVALRQAQERRSARFELNGADARIAGLFDLFYRATAAAAESPPARAPGFVERLGHGTRTSASDVLALIAFSGEITLAFGRAVRRPGRIRWQDVLRTAEAAGSDALPIVSMLGLMIGVIMAFQSLAQLRWFGADLYVANLVGLALLRELGPLLTAVVLAGRTGSAFAAEIGTMRVNEEVDALTTMGLDPVSFLIVPRLIAAVCVTPLLTVFMSLSGMIGAMLVMMSFGYPPITFINRVIEVATPSDLLSGLFKAFVFGVLVSSIGCLRGLQTGGGPAAVGAAATSAVVSGIILIMVADFVFSIMFFALGV